MSTRRRWTTQTDDVDETSGRCTPAVVDTQSRRDNDKSRSKELNNTDVLAPISRQSTGHKRTHGLGLKPNSTTRHSPEAHSPASSSATPWRHHHRHLRGRQPWHHRDQDGHGGPGSPDVTLISPAPTTSSPRKLSSPSPLTWWTKEPARAERRGNGGIGRFNQLWQALRRRRSPMATRSPTSPAVPSLRAPTPGHRKGQGWQRTRAGQRRPHEELRPHRSHLHRNQVGLNPFKFGVDTAAQPVLSGQDRRLPEERRRLEAQTTTGDEREVDRQPEWVKVTFDLGRHGAPGSRLRAGQSDFQVRLVAPGLGSGCQQRPRAQQSTCRSANC